ncbi:MAG: hypothetical protein AAGA48_04540 [Myxococcota bacterium]
MYIVSLVVNILVLIPVCASLLSNAAWVSDAYGPRTHARGILLSIYAAILVASVALLFIGDLRMTTALLAIQIFYKVTTPFTVGTTTNPVVLCNLAIAALHTVTLAS